MKQRELPLLNVLRKSFVKVVLNRQDVRQTVTEGKSDSRLFISEHEPAGEKAWRGVRAVSRHLKREAGLCGSEEK